MAIRASEVDGFRGVHGGFVGRGVAGDAAGAGGRRIQTRQNGPAFMLKSRHFPPRIK